MRIRALVEWEEDNTRAARAVSDALQPCNVKAPRNIKIRTGTRGSKVVTELKMEGELHTLLATLDDLLKCAITAAEVLK